MKNSIKIWQATTICLAILVIAQIFVITSKRNYFKNFEIKGSISPCTKDCYRFNVLAVYAGTDIVEYSQKTEYGGNLVAQICEDIILSMKCTDLDITKLPDYKMVSVPNIIKLFPNYTYINRYVDSGRYNKIYFLYRRMPDTDLDKSRWVYDEQLVVISFDKLTKEIKKEGELSVNGLNVKEMHISPDGSHLLIVDSSNPRYLPNTTNSNIIFFDIKNKITKSFAKVGQGSRLEFLAWIDNKHFFYEEYGYMGEDNVIYRIGEIK